MSNIFPVNFIYTPLPMKPYSLTFANYFRLDAAIAATKGKVHLAIVDIDLTMDSD